jgi:hypothetical protein
VARSRTRILFCFLVGQIGFTASLQAQDRVIGLLTLPEIFSTGPCVPFTPLPVTVYAQPRGAAIGTIEVDKNWIIEPAGSCDGLQVSVHQGEARRELPTREHAYEAPAVIVLERRNGWFKIRLSDGTGWVAPSTQHEFLDLARLFKEDESITATTAQFTGQLHRDPGGEVFGDLLKEYQPVVVKEVRQVRGREWLRIEVLSHSACDGNINIEPFAIAKGWLPAHKADGEPTVWFYSRGC